MSGRNVGVKVHFGMPYDPDLAEVERQVDLIVAAGLKALGLTGWCAGTCYTFVEVVDRDGRRTERTWTLAEYLARDREGPPPVPPPKPPPLVYCHDATPSLPKE